MNKFLSSLSVLVLASVASFSAHADAIKGDAKAAQAKVAMCIGCHGIVGYQASFPEIHKVPMISGQSAEYIAAALTAYQKGDRKHSTMRGIAASLTEQDIADVAAYYAASGAVAGATVPEKAKEGSAKTMALLAKGTCIACHGDNFNQPKVPGAPKLAGQHADYLFVALKAYKNTQSAQVGRSNPSMAGVVTNFTNAELQEMAKYLASLPGDLKVVPQSRFK